MKDPTIRTLDVKTRPLNANINARDGSSGRIVCDSCLDSITDWTRPIPMLLRTDTGNRRKLTYEDFEMYAKHLSEDVGAIEGGGSDLAWPMNKRQFITRNLEEEADEPRERELIILRPYKKEDVLTLLRCYDEKLAAELSTRNAEAYKGEWLVLTIEAMRKIPINCPNDVIRHLQLLLRSELAQSHILEILVEVIDDPSIEVFLVMVREGRLGSPYVWANQCILGMRAPTLNFADGQHTSSIGIAILGNFNK